MESFAVIRACILTCSNNICVDLLLDSYYEKATTWPSVVGWLPHHSSVGSVIPAVFVLMGWHHATSHRYALMAWWTDHHYNIFLTWTRWCSHDQRFGSHVIGSQSFNLVFLLSKLSHNYYIPVKTQINHGKAVPKSTLMIDSVWYGCMTTGSQTE